MDASGILKNLVVYRTQMKSCRCTQAVSDAHDFNWETMDVTHLINHLSFGPFLSEQVRSL